jgi:hypothetical protein
VVAWWQDATSLDTATELTVTGPARNILLSGLDARIQKAQTSTTSSAFPDTVNFAQRYDLGHAIQFTALGGCPQKSLSRPLVITGCLGLADGARWRAHARTGMPAFTRLLDAELPAVHAEPLTGDNLVIVFLFHDHYVAFDYDQGRNLLTSSLSSEKVAVRPPDAFVQGLASFIAPNKL